MKKAFQVTGLSNALGGHEDALIICDDALSYELHGEVFEIWDISQKKKLKTTYFSRNSEHSSSEDEESCTSSDNTSSSYCAPDL